MSEQTTRDPTAKPAPIQQRIRAAMNGRRSADYHEILRAVFPPEQFPRAFRYQQNGGPPGCAMAFGRALRKMGWVEGRLDKASGRRIHVREGNSNGA